MKALTGHLLMKTILIKAFISITQLKDYINRIILSKYYEKRILDCGSGYNKEG